MFKIQEVSYVPHDPSHYSSFLLFGACGLPVGGRDPSAIWSMRLSLRSTWVTLRQRLCTALSIAVT